MIDRHADFYRERLGLELDEPMPERLVKIDEAFTKQYSHIGGPPLNSTTLLVLMAVAGCFDDGVPAAPAKRATGRTKKELVEA